jgi:PPM family protein phosphatase
VKCPGCGSDNLPDARYCEGCGMALGAEGTGGTGRSRKGARSDAVDPRALEETSPLPAFSDQFAALPEGAILGQRYLVREARVVGEAQNVYLAEDLNAGRQCPVCRAFSEELSERYCASCGADLASTSTIVRRYLVQERADSGAFATERKLLAMQLSHPGLLLPQDVFEEAPYGPPRIYRVMPEFSPPLVQSLGLPQGWQGVVVWGISLAEAMAYLHQHQIAVRAVDTAHIAVDGDRAMWAGLDAVEVVPPAERRAGAQPIVEDLRQLASTLVHLLTGGPRPSGVEPLLPDALKRLLAGAYQHPETLGARELALRLAAFLNEARPAVPFALSVGYRTDAGSVRELNEDNLLVLDLAPPGATKTMGLFVVADGMGGYDRGEVASELACQAIADFRRRSGTLQGVEPAEWLVDAFQAANTAVHKARRAADSEMGTTVVATLITDGATAGGALATIANVGDSRCYHLDGDSIRRVTVDHSFVEQLLMAGQITATEAATHPQRNVITRAIGDRPEIEVDLYAEVVAPNEALLLCSDGLSGMISDERIFQIWRTAVSPQDACDRLVEAAVQAGGEDNITAILVQVVAA